MDTASEDLYRELQPKLTNMTREKIGTLVVPRPSPDVINDILQLDAPSADCADILDDLGIDQFGIPATVLRPFLDDARIAGPALTILNAPGSSGRWPYEFTDIFEIAHAGDVIVISGEGYEHAGSWGGTTTGLATERGLAGTISKWPSRDSEEIIQHGYPVWSPGYTPIPTKRYLVTKAIMVPIDLHGVQVRPGDLVVADSAGVIVIPHEQIAEIHARIRA